MPRSIISSDEEGQGVSDDGRQPEQRSNQQGSSMEEMFRVLTARLINVEKELKRKRTPSPPPDSKRLKISEHRDSSEVVDSQAGPSRPNVEGNSHSDLRGEATINDSPTPPGDMGGGLADGQAPGLPALPDYKFNNEIEIPPISPYTVPPRILQRSQELTTTQEMLRLAGFKYNVYGDDEIRFVIPSNFFGLVKGTKPGGALFKDSEDISSKRAEKVFKEIIPDIVDGDLATLNHLLFQRIDFKSGIPPYTFKPRVASSSLFRAFSIAKNALIQSFQMMFFITMVLNSSDYSRLETFIREVYLPMWGNQLLLFFKTIEDIKFAMLPYYCRFLNIHSNKPIMDNVWNLSQDNISAIKKAFSSNKYKYSDNQSSSQSSSQSQSFRDSSKKGKSSYRGNKKIPFKGQRKPSGKEN